MSNSRYRNIAGVAALLAGSLSGCAGGSGSDGTFQPAATATPEPSKMAAPIAKPTVSTAQADRVVLKQYREYQRLYKQVYATGDPSPLANLAIDPLLGIVTKDVQAEAAAGFYWKFTNILNPKIGSRSADLTSIVVLDCVRTLGAYKYSRETRKRVARAGDTGTHVYQAKFLYDGTTWKIAEARKGKRC